ncbi:TPA: terminase large subunit [Streptococcus suis]
MIKYVRDYINEYESGNILFNQERVDLVAYINREIVPRLDKKEVYFDEKMIDNCIKFIEKWFFKLENFQKFIISFVFLRYTANHRNVYKSILIMMGRGGGKNGLISGIIAFLLSPFHGIKNYNVSLVANSEDQAKTSFDEIYNTIESNPKLKEIYYNTKSEIKSLHTNSVMRFRTSNGNTKDGLRDGMVVFDEIHQYESNKDVRVHKSGLGKVKNSREFYIGTDGYVRDGFIDSMKEKAKKVLRGEARWNSMFAFICKIDEEKEVDDKEKWQKANPMFHKPMSEYAEELFDLVSEQYEEMIEDPSNREEFMTKRMDYPVMDTERSVATYEELVATKRDFPDLRDEICIGGLDYAAVRDFAAVGLLFKVGDDYVWDCHSFVRKEFVDTYYGYSRPKDSVNGKRQFAPIKKWEDEGWLTVIDEPTINPKYVVDWFVRMRDEYGYDLQRIVADNYKMDLLKPFFEKEGFEVQFKGEFEAPVGYQVEVLRNPKASDSLVAPKIETAFARHNVIFGKNDMMRWYTNNVLRKLKSDGNVVYEKKEDTRRKTDGFKAFQYAMWRSGQLDIEVDLEFYDDVMEWY